MPVIDAKKTSSEANAAARRVCFSACAPSVRLGIAAVLLPVCVLIVGCGGEKNPDSRPKQSARRMQLTGDWYDEYEKERKSRRLNPEDRVLITKPRECLIAAKDALNKKNYERAYDLANYVLKTEPQNAEAHFIRGAGIFYSAFGEESDAIKDLEKARELGYQSAELFSALAKLYDAKKDYDRAIEAASYGIKVCSDKDLLRCRASLYQAVGKRKEALIDLNSFIEQAPDKSMGYYMRANLFQQLGRDEDALRDLAVCNTKNPDSTIALTERSKLFLKLGRYKEALAEISKVADYDKSDDDAVRLRGDIYARINQNERAISDYTLAISMSPEYARAALEARAKLYAKLGKRDLAAQDLSEASKLKAKPAEKPVYDLKW
ncbi:tetratricopeptide repeat protein [Candidatus Obscuribacterales bacterium]|nr:tetratricopeptide repeat protein [Candidatus Obscuribacterales bacterium]